MSLLDPLEKALTYGVSYAPLSWAAGRLSDVRLPRPLIGGLVSAYTAAFGIPRDELDRDPAAYGCMNAFFTRGLAPGRELPQVADDVLACPVDGVLQEAGLLRGNQTFVVKGQEIDVVGLTGDDLAAERFSGGTYALIYLSPRHYHRVHAPVAAEWQGFRYIPGRFFPVNSLGMRHAPRMFLRNERVVLFFETPRGSVWMVMVGASFVGRMTLVGEDFATNESLRKVPLERAFDPLRDVAALDEVGAFNLGSSVVILAEAPADPESLAREGEIRVGDPLARF